MPSYHINELKNPTWTTITHTNEIVTIKVQREEIEMIWSKLNLGVAIAKQSLNKKLWDEQWMKIT